MNAVEMVDTIHVKISLKNPGSTKNITGQATRVAKIKQPKSLMTTSFVYAAMLISKSCLAIHNVIPEFATFSANITIYGISGFSNNLRNIYDKGTTKSNIDAENN